MKKIEYQETSRQGERRKSFLEVKEDEYKDQVKREICALLMKCGEAYIVAGRKKE